MAMMLGTMAAGNASLFVSDYSKAKVSAAKIFTLFNRNPLIDSMSKDGNKMVSRHIRPLPYDTKTSACSVLLMNNSK